MDVTHDLMEMFVHFFGTPGDMHCVLGHFQTGSRYTACIDSFTRAIHDFCSKESVDCFGTASHVRYFTYAHNSVGNQLFGILFVYFVLSSARHGDIHFLFPGFLACIECGIRILFCIRCYDIIATGTKLEHIIDLFAGDAIRIINVAVGTGDGNYFRSQFRCFCCRSPCYVTKT